MPNSWHQAVNDFSCRVAAITNFLLFYNVPRHALHSRARYARAGV